MNKYSSMVITFLTAQLLQLLPQKSAANDLTIIDVRRNITLSNDEIPYKDFYITGEGTSALKKDSVLTAFRKINVRDSMGAQAFGEINIPVGQIKIIAVYGNIAIAREAQLLSRDTLPMLEQIGIMSGDKVE